MGSSMIPHGIWDPQQKQEKLSTLAGKPRSMVPRLDQPHFGGIKVAVDFPLQQADAGLMANVTHRTRGMINRNGRHV